MGLTVIVIPDDVFRAPGATESQFPPEVVDTLVVNESVAPASEVVNVTG